jgi:curli biogenesis system outer membrane secretion channel CsgG
MRWKFSIRATRALRTRRSRRGELWQGHGPKSRVVGPAGGLLIASMALVFSSVPASAAETQRPSVVPKARIAVLDFDFAESNRSAVREKVQSDLLTTKINTALVSSRRFDVVERQSLDLVLTEGKFSRSMLADPAQAARLGKLVSASYVVLGEISVMEVGGEKSRVPYVERWKGEVAGVMVLDFRVVNVKTGKIERAAKVEASLRQTTRIDSAADSVTPGMLFYEDLQREAAEKTASKIVSSVFPLKVSKFDAGVAYLNAGEGTGIDVGDLYIVQEMGEEIFDPDSGDSLGRVERPVAVIEVTAVEEKRSKARSIGSHGPLSVGMICRRATAAEAQAFLSGGGQ